MIKLRIEKTLLSPNPFDWVVLRRIGFTFVLIFQIFQVGCSTNQQHGSTAAVIGTNSLVSPNGKNYQVLVTAEQDRFIETESEPDSTLRTMSLTAVSSSDNEDFAGTDRKAAKTSISTGPMETFTNLADLLACLPTDDDMLRHNPPITKASDSERVVEEETNVTVTAFLFAAKGESDNDFHLILGSSSDQTSADFMNVEISGLPGDEPSRTELSSPRKAFKDFFGDKVPGKGGYQRFNPPIPVHVSGSQFYDIDHKPGAVGPRDMAPTTAWEIHPVSSISFEGSSQ